MSGLFCWDVWPLVRTPNESEQSPVHSPVAEVAVCSKTQTSKDTIYHPTVILSPRIE